MGSHRRPAALSSGPRNWVLSRAEEIVSQYKHLTIEGWDPELGGNLRARAERAALRDEFGTRRAKAEIIATLVTIAVQAVPPDATVDWLVQQTLWINGVKVRAGTAIVAAIIAGYEPLPSKGGRSLGLRR